MDSKMDTKIVITKWASFPLSEYVVTRANFLAAWNDAKAELAEAEKKYGKSSKEYQTKKITMKLARMSYRALDEI
jgi:hypothetical protein